MLCYDLMNVSKFEVLGVDNLFDKDKKKQIFKFSCIWNLLFAAENSILRTLFTCFCFSEKLPLVLASANYINTKFFHTMTIKENVLKKKLICDILSNYI